MITINAKFKFAIASIFFLVAILGGLVYLQTERLGIHSESIKSLDIIYSSVTSSRGLLLDYLRYHLDRPKSQWHLESDKILEFLDSRSVFGHEDDIFLNDIKELKIKTNLIFDRLVKNYEDSKFSHEELDRSRNLEGVITGELMQVLQNSISKSRTQIDYHVNASSALINEIMFEIRFSVLLVLSIILYCYFYFNTTLIRPLGKLRKSIAAMTSGDLSTRLKIEVRDELGDISNLFNSMADKLQASHQDLEKSVENKTAELNKKVADLEKMNLFMVDREMRMVELKKQIKDLQAGAK